MGQGLGLVGAERRNSCGLCCGVDRFEQRLAGAAAGAGDADPKALLQFTKQCLEEVTASVMHAAAGVTARLDQQVCVCLWILVFGVGPAPPPRVVPRPPASVGRWGLEAAG
jgi:hypothetical protein